MGNTHIRSPKGQGVSLSGDDQSSDRFAEIFDIDGLLRAADPCEIHPVLVIDCATLEILGGNRAVARVFGHSIHELRGLTPARLHVDADSYRTFRRLVRTDALDWMVRLSDTPLVQSATAKLMAQM